ncbi:hypothetical protein K2X83_01950 [Patescibacteria group bacterium]|nr:hypothetical protein [Patescibacteria group bacterium]
MRAFFVAVLILTILPLVPVSVFGHGAGAFYETTVGNFIVDIGYSSPAPTVGEAVVFDFQVRTVGTKLISGSDTEFSDVWVRIESEKKVLLATGLYNAEFGGPRLSYVFLKEGDYTVYARYENGSETLAEVSFPLTVLPSSEGSDSTVTWHLIYGVIGTILGFLVAVFLKKYIRF